MQTLTFFFAIYSHGCGIFIYTLGIHIIIHQWNQPSTLQALAYQYVMDRMDDVVEYTLKIMLFLYDIGIIERAYRRKKVIECYKQ